MIFKQAVKQKTNWGLVIRRRREALHESKAQFGRRFGVTGQAVYYWESHQNDPPGEVTWWLYKGGKK